MNFKTVIVTGINGNVGQGILRNIRNTFNNIKLIGTDVASFTCANYLCDNFYQLPFAYDQNYISEMLKIIKQEKVDLIIPSTDYEVYYLSKYKSLLNVKIAASDEEISEIYLDKYLSFLHHKKHNIPFAKTWLPKDYDFSCNDIIVKPRKGRGSRGIEINPIHPSNYSDDYIIQSFEKGVEITSAVYVNHKNKLHGVFTMERELTNGTTTKSKVIFDYDKQIYEIAEKMISVKGLRGSFNIQSIVNHNNDVIPFEINCRISGTNSIRHNLGFQDVKYTLQEFLYNELPDKPNPIKGMATRILLDVIYPEITDEKSINNSSSNYIIY